MFFFDGKISELLHSMHSCKSDVTAWASVNMFTLYDNDTICLYDGVCMYIYICVYVHIDFYMFEHALSG